jgi:hypothetical protein
MFKRERVNGDWILATACLLRRDIQSSPTNLRQFHRGKLTSRDLSAVLARVSRPTRAEIEADEYEGCVPILQRLGRASRRCD